MGRSKFPKPSSLTPVKQAFNVCAKYENFSYKVDGRNSVLIRGYLKPSSMHPIYQIEISYTFGKFPKVKIISPTITPEAPHTFDDNSICTFYPDSEVWNRTMKISETIIPWICDWIFQYEIWLITGNWNGDSHPKHPRRQQRAS